MKLKDGIEITDNSLVNNVILIETEFPVVTATAERNVSIRQHIISRIVFSSYLTIGIVIRLQHETSSSRR